MAESAVELRTLSSLKSRFIVPEAGKVVELPFEVIVKEMKAIFDKYAQKELLIEKILAFLKKDSEVATFERINTLVEFLQCYPLLVRKNKNASPDIEAVMNNEPKMK